MRCALAVVVTLAALAPAAAEVAPAAPATLFGFAKGKTRAEIVAEAKRRVGAALGANLADFPVVTVDLGASALRVQFEARIAVESSAPQTSTIVLSSTVDRDTLRPTTQGALPAITDEMRAIARSFPKTAYLVFRVIPAGHEVDVTLARGTIETWRAPRGKKRTLLRRERPALKCGHAGCDR